MNLARRDFLRGAVAAPFAPGLNAGIRPPRSCILLVLTGGPSQLDTWDMKPDAPREIRGPFRPIRTNVPGIQISEIFPRMARHADKYALIRSVYSDAAPVHEDNLRPLDLATAGHVTLPGPIGFMGSAAAVSSATATSEREFETDSFADNCLRAAKLAEAGAPLVRVNMFGTVFHRSTWDSHGSRPFSTVRDYKEHVGPAFDFAYSMLLEYLSQRGLLEATMVVATGEFGRSPRINPSGGRDHWTKCWTVLMAGGGIRGGQVYGSSDSQGAEPRDRAVNTARVIATIQQACGVGPQAEPLRELFV